MHGVKILSVMVKKGKINSFFANFLSILMRFLVK